MVLTGVACGAVVALLLTAFAAPEPAARPDVLVLLIDTLRPDHLSCYGYSRATSPRIDALGAGGFVFERCFTPSPWTNPSIIALFSGRSPRASVPAVPHAEAIKQAVAPEIATLAEVLRGSGYRTAAFVDHPGINEWLGYDQGFDDFQYLPAGWHEWVGSRPEVVTSTFARQLDSLAAAPRRPFFHYMHLVYPHAPYTPPPAFAGRFGPGFREVRPEEKEGVVNRYDEEILLTDAVTGAIVDSLAARGLLATTWIFLVSDHGEAFWEHGVWEHGNTFHDELLRVPLVVRPPGAPRAGGTSSGGAVNHSGRGAGHRVKEAVSLIDLYPTILELAGAGASAPPGLDGRSLVPRLRPARGAAAIAARLRDARDRLAGRREERILFGENAHTACVHGFACREGRWKLIYSPPDAAGEGELEGAASIGEVAARIAASPRTALFDLAGDPGELRAIRAGEEDRVKRMALEIARHREATRRIREAVTERRQDLDPATIRQLKALGYLR